MSKKLVIVFIALLSCSAFAQVKDNSVLLNRRGPAVKAYISNRYAVGDMANFSICNIGSGIGIEYNLPFYPILGVSANSEFEGVITTDKRIDYWLSSTFMGGVYMNIDFNSFFKIKPEISYGVLLHSIKLENSNQIFSDQIIQLAVNMDFTPKKFRLYGLTIEVTPTYSLLTEQKDAVHYLGLRAGINYQFN